MSYSMVERGTEPVRDETSCSSQQVALWEPLRCRARGMLSKYLGRERIEHSVRVAATARELAERFGADPDRAELAGLLHDVARDMTPDELIRIALKTGIVVANKVPDFPMCLHGPVGAFLARSELGIADEELLLAVSSHVTGRHGWTRLEQVVYLADKVEPGRSHPGVEAVRGLLARGDFDGALKRSLTSAIAYCMESGLPVHPETVVVLSELSPPR